MMEAQDTEIKTSMQTKEDTVHRVVMEHKMGMGLKQIMSGKNIMEISIYMELKILMVHRITMAVDTTNRIMCKLSNTNLYRKKANHQN